MIERIRAWWEQARDPLTTVSVNVDTVPSTQWTIDTRIIDGVDLATLAEALTTVVRERFGFAFTYPDVQKGTTRIRAEWQLDRRRRYWWRLGIMLSGSPGAPPTLSAYVGPGDAQTVAPSVTEVTANATEIAAISAEFARVLEATAARTRSRAGSQRVLFYVELQPPWTLDADTTLPAFHAEMLLNVVVKPNGARVAAVVVTVHESTQVAARERAAAVVALIAALLTLISGRSAGTWLHRPDAFLHPEIAPARREEIYPTRFFKEDREEYRRDLAQRIRVVSEVFGRLAEPDRDMLDRMLYAYAAGKDVEQRHPTMAAVAYLAVLAAGLERAQCDEAICVSHGARASHAIRGERDRILERLLERGVALAAERDDVRELLKRAYGGQRSAFVHDAHVAHDEHRRRRLLGLPTTDRIVPQEWETRNDLSRLEALSRGLVFRELAARAGVALKGPPVPVSVREATGLEAAVRARPHVRLRIDSLASRPLYVVAAPGGEIDLVLRDLVADPRGDRDSTERT